ncbi:hypothetical protein HDU76_005953, partial [Blyttiomyces sp. JEL0837]
MRKQAQTTPNPVTDQSGEIIPPKPEYSRLLHLEKRKKDGKRLSGSETRELKRLWKIYEAEKKGENCERPSKGNTGTRAVVEQQDQGHLVSTPAVETSSDHGRERIERNDTLKSLDLSDALTLLPNFDKTKYKTLAKRFGISTPPTATIAQQQVSQSASNKAPTFESEWNDLPTNFTSQINDIINLYKSNKNLYWRASANLLLHLAQRDHNPEVPLVSKFKTLCLTDYITIISTHTPLQHNYVKALRNMEKNPQENACHSKDVIYVYKGFAKMGTCGVGGPPTKEKVVAVTVSDQLLIWKIGARRTLQKLIQAPGPMSFYDCEDVEDVASSHMKSALASARDVGVVEVPIPRLLIYPDAFKISGKHGKGLTNLKTRVEMLPLVSTAVCAYCGLPEGGSISGKIGESELTTSTGQLGTSTTDNYNIKHDKISLKQC